MKKVIFIIIMLVTGNMVTRAQLTPFFTNSIENGIVDYATDRLFINDVMDLPLDNSYKINKNIRNWAKDFFNANTGYKLNQESDKISQTIEYFYKTEFSKKTTPRGEKMGLSAPLVYSNQYIVTYRVFYGHASDDVVINEDIATFDRNDGHRMTVKEIFKCDENTISKLMKENLPEGFSTILNPENEIKVVSAGIGRKTIDVAGTLFKGCTTVCQIPFEDAREYLTEKAYKMHGMLISNEGTIFSDMAPVSWAKSFFVYLFNKTSISYGKYHNISTDKNYYAQLDVKYDFDKDGNVRNKKSKPKIYLEVPSDDNNKEAYLEFSKSDASSFIEHLKDYQKDFNNWKKKMSSQNFKKYKLSDNDDGKTNISFFKKGDNKYGYDEGIEYVCQYTYDKYSNSTVIVLTAKNKQGVEKKSLKLGSNGDKTLSMNVYEDKLSGWTLVIEQPEKEIPEICKAIQNCIDRMK